MPLCSLGTMRLLLDHQSAPKPRNVLARQPASATVDQVRLECPLRKYSTAEIPAQQNVGSSPAWALDQPPDFVSAWPAIMRRPAQQGGSARKKTAMVRQPARDALPSYSGSPSR